MEEIKEIGLLNRKVLNDHPSFKDASMLVTTRREKSELCKKIGQRWAKDHGVPFYWWYKRPSKGGMSNEEADAISQGMYRYCPDVEGYYIQGAPCMMKRNISPPLGYANGSEGKMIGIVPKEGNVLRPGAPGEMIRIEPPEYVIMEVSHKKGEQKWTTIVPCKRERVTLDYRRNGQEKKFTCWSNSVNLMFAFTIHETQGQTLKKVILLLGRMPGLHVGQISWSLLYVALSRTRELNDIKFFPCGIPGFTNFQHLTRLKPSSKFVKWNSGYRNHAWCPEILENQNLTNERNVENKLLRQGPGESLSKTNTILKGYLTGLNYQVLSKELRPQLQRRIISHMERKKLWNLGEDKSKFITKRGTQKRKISRPKKKVVRKSRKLSDDKKSESLNLVKNGDSVKAKRKLPKKALPNNKKKLKKKDEVKMLPERYLLPDDLEFDKFIFERKGYRINPIERDGNCLFRAVSDQVYCDHNLHANIRNLCADFMQEEEKHFSNFILGSMDYTKYISDLRKDGAWGGNYEIIALSKIFNREIEVYEHSEEPKKFNLSNNQTNNVPPIRLFFRNKHYSSIRSDGVGDLFDFEGLEPAEIEQQYPSTSEIRKSKEYQKRIQSQKENLSKLDPNVRQAIEESIAMEEAHNAYLRFYASRLIKTKGNQ